MKRTKMLIAMALFITPLLVAVMWGNYDKTGRVFASLSSYFKGTQTRYNWEKDCQNGYFPLSTEIPNVENVPRRADLTRFDRQDDKSSEPPFGPPMNNVLCFAEFVLDPRNEKRFDSYNLNPSGDVSIEMDTKEYNYSIYVSKSAIEVYVYPSNQVSGSLLAWQDSALDGRVDGMSRNRFNHAEQPKGVSEENTNLMNERSVDGMYRLHLQKVMVHLGLPWTNDYGLLSRQ